MCHFCYLNELSHIIKIPRVHFGKKVTLFYQLINSYYSLLLWLAGLSRLKKNWNPHGKKMHHSKKKENLAFTLEITPGIFRAILVFYFLCILTIIVKNSLYTIFTKVSSLYLFKYIWAIDLLTSLSIIY